MMEKSKRIAKNCQTCKEYKYNRRPNKPQFQPTPIPKNPGEIIHIDIYSTEGNLVLTAIDKFSKYALGKILKSKAVEDIKEPLKKIILAFGIPKFIVLDNEKSLNSVTINFLLKDQFGKQTYTTPPYASTVNGQVVILHSTLSEMMRCLKSDKLHNSFHDLLTKTLYEYNKSIHSTTGKRPIDIFFNKNFNSDPGKTRNNKSLD